MGSRSAANGTVTEPRRITDEVVRAGRPEYSRDGRIAFVSWGSGRPMSTWVMNEDGTARQPLLPDVQTTNPSWGPDNRVLVSRNPGKNEPALSWVDVTTQRATALSNLSLDGLRFPRVSPDGRDVAFWTLETSGVMNVWTLALDGSSPAGTA